MDTHKLVVLTGASGSGKTAIVDYIREHFADKYNIQICRTDSLPVPSHEEMVRDFGSGENWQRARTFECVGTIASDYIKHHHVIFEGQMRIAFIDEALKKENLTHATILLIDCSDDVRAYRLKELRQQPELFNDQMINWAAYLRNEATQRGLNMIDTSVLSIEDAAKNVMSYLAS